MPSTPDRRTMLERAARHRATPQCTDPDCPEYPTGDTRCLDGIRTHPLHPQPDTVDLAIRFDYHPPSNPTIAANHEHVRAICRTTAEAIVRHTPPGREQALALTALEQTMFWANAAIARHHTNTTP